MSQETYPATLGGRVRYARERRELGVNELDRLIGSESGYVSKLEANKIGSVGSDKLAALGSVLSVSLDWLVSGKGSFATRAA